MQKDQVQRCKATAGGVAQSLINFFSSIAKHVLAAAAIFKPGVVILFNYLGFKVGICKK